MNTSRHRSSRRSRPGWRFRKAFYRRGHIYEDIRKKERLDSEVIAGPSIHPPSYEVGREEDADNKQSRQPFSYDEGGS